MQSKTSLRLPIPAAILAGSLSFSFAANAIPLPDNTLPQPFGVQLKGPNSSAENLDKIQGVGLKMVRRGFLWGAVETTPGVYDFTIFDRIVKDCKDRGLGVIGCIALGNPLYGPVYEDKGRQAYAQYAAALAAHYKGEKIYWEIWNEPNTRTFWGKHGMHNSELYADQYVALVKATVPAMKQADPNCTVMAGAVSGLWSASFEWMNFCFAKGILKTGIDAWSVHPYSTKNPEDYVEAYATMRASMAKNGGPDTIPVFDSERGFPLGQAEGAAGGDPALAKEYQAWHIVRQFMVDQACGIRATIWYEWSGKEGFSLNDPAEETQAMKATKVMIAQLTGYKFDKRLDLGSPRDFALRFVNPNGGIKIVTWAGPPAGGTPDEIKNHPAQVKVDGDTGATLDTATLYGEKGTLPVKNSAVEVALTGAPQYLTVKAGK